MKTCSLIFTLLALFAFYQAQAFENCGAIPVNYTIFNLCAFSNASPFVVPGFQDSTTFTLGQPHTDSCDGHEEIWAKYYDRSGQCVDMATESPAYTILDENDLESGLQIAFPIEHDSQATNKSYQLIVRLACDKGASDVGQTQFTITYDGLVDGVNQIVLTGGSSSGCPVVSFNQLIDFLTSNRHAFALVFALIGLFLTFFGLQLFKAAVFVITVVTGTLMAGTVFFEFTDMSTESWILWTIFGVSVVVGLLLGYLALRFEKLAYFVIGVTFGVVAGFMIFNALVLPFIQGNGSVLPLYLTLIACGLLGGGLGLCLIKGIVIIATSFAGAYMIVRAASVYFGGFPSETLVSRGNENFSPVVYAYLVAVILVTALGVYYQSGARKRTEEISAPQDRYYRY